MKRIIALMFVLVLALGMFAGCGKDKEKTNSSDNGSSAPTVTDDVFSKEKVTYLADDGSAVYRIVRSEGDEGSLAVSQLLFKQMKNILGVNCRNVTDTEDGTDVYEILVGNTNRPETAQAKAYLDQNVGGRYNDYIICTIGKKIVIYGQSAEAVTQAAEYFIANFCKAEGVDGGFHYTKAAEGNFESMTVNGVEVGRFRFIRPHYNSSYLTEIEMEKMRDSVYQKTGYMMSILHDTQTEPADYEVIIGNTNRDGVEALTNYDEYKITVSGKKVYINGGSAHSTAMGVAEFAKMVSTAALTDASSVTGSYETALNSYDKSSNYYKTWGDDFDGAVLDRTKWRQVVDPEGRAAGKNGKMSIRSGDPNDVFLSDGKFYICAREDSDYYYGGMLRTDQTMNYKYGYSEMSAVLPQGNGFWIAWWTGTKDGVSAADSNLPIYLKPEIDIVECMGNTAQYVPTSHQWPTAEGTALGFEHSALQPGDWGNKYACDPGVLLGSAFHTYGFLWDNTKIGFTCDGNLFFTYDTTTSFEDTENHNHSMYFILSMATAFDSIQTNITDNPVEWAETNKFIVDWLNIYQKDDGLHELDWYGRDR